VVGPTADQKLPGPPPHDRAAVPSGPGSLEPAIPAGTPARRV